MGYYIYAYRHFMSLIKGGHTNYKVRVATEKKRHRGDQLDMLVAFDQRTIDENLYEMRKGGAVLYNAGAFEPVIPEDAGVIPVAVPMQQIAKDHGSIVMTNMAAMGASPRSPAWIPPRSTISSPSVMASTAKRLSPKTAKSCEPATPTPWKRPTGELRFLNCPSFSR